MRPSTEPDVAQQPTRLIERDSLLDLLDATRDSPARVQLAHTVPRRVTTRPYRSQIDREPSALRGLVMVVLLGLLIRELIHFVI